MRGGTAPLRPKPGMRAHHMVRASVSRGGTLSDLNANLRFDAIASGGSRAADFGISVDATSTVASSESEDEGMAAIPRRGVGRKPSPRAGSRPPAPLAVREAAYAIGNVHSARVPLTGPSGGEPGVGKRPGAEAAVLQRGDGPAPLDRPAGSPDGSDARIYSVSPRLHPVRLKRVSSARAAAPNAASAAAKQARTPSATLAGQRTHEYAPVDVPPWAQQEAPERPPSRQRDAFPKHLTDLSARKAAFTRELRPAPDPFSQEQAMLARKRAAEAPRPPSRHKPPPQVRCSAPSRGARLPASPA